jgi:succinylglutamate desuccinylase
VAQRFRDAGFTVGLPAKGVLTVKAAAPMQERPAVLLSVGVHGDETGPIEMVAHAIEPCRARRGAGGGPDAVRREHRRDRGRQALHRRRPEPHVPPDRGALAGTFEAGRADTLIAATDAFFAGTGPHAGTSTCTRRSALRATRCSRSCRT